MIFFRMEKRLKKVQTLLSGVALNKNQLYIMRIFMKTFPTLKYLHLNIHPFPYNIKQNVQSTKKSTQRG